MILLKSLQRQSVTQNRREERITKWSTVTWNWEHTLFLPQLHGLLSLSVQTWLKGFKWANQYKMRNRFRNLKLHCLQHFLIYCLFSWNLSFPFPTHMASDSCKHQLYDVLSSIQSHAFPIAKVTHEEHWIGSQQNEISSCNSIKHLVNYLGHLSTSQQPSHFIFKGTGWITKPLPALKFCLAWIVPPICPSP